MSSSSENDERAARLGVQEARLKVAYAAVCLAVLGWYLIPEHRKEQALMRLRHAAAPAMTTALAEWHRLAVRRAMKREAETGVEDYALSVRIHGWWQRWEQP